MRFPINTVSISWSTSRGVNSYGWNICRLDDNRTGKRYRTCGGGYDMIGTVLGEWLADAYQDRLRAIGDKAGSYYSKAGGYHSHRTEDGRNPARGYYYGMTRNDDTGRITLDGACGSSTMRGIAEAIGVTLTSYCDKKGRVLGYFIADQFEQVAA